MVLTGQAKGQARRTGIAVSGAIFEDGICVDLQVWAARDGFHGCQALLEVILSMQHLDAVTIKCWESHDSYLNLSNGTEPVTLSFNLNHIPISKSTLQYHDCWGPFVSNFLQTHGPWPWTATDQVKSQRSAAKTSCVPGHVGDLAQGRPQCWRLWHELRSTRLSSPRRLATCVCHFP